MIQLTCPRCQSVLAFEDALAGTVVACPDCEARIRVPVNEPRPQPPDDDEPIEPEPDEVADGPEKNDVVVSLEDAAVLAELDALQNAKPGWGGAIVMLFVSLIVYMGAARTQEIWDSILILIPVLAFHEAGHFLAMRLFGYRNLRMFFVPFFGAAVTGQHYNVEGWKKAVVALAGPIPGVIAAMPIGIAGLAMSEPRIIEVAMLMLILNGFNLLPFLPLDGGWVVHAILFVRHPVLDIVFRIAAALTLLGLAILMGDWCLIALAVFMLLAAPMAYRQARMAYRLREEGLAARSLDAHTIPQEAALQILAEVRRAMPGVADPRILAQHVAQVFETCNAEPPGVLASVALLGLHCAGFAAALVLAIVMAVLQHWPAG